MVGRAASADEEVADDRAQSIWGHMARIFPSIA
jgi:hypothetical protein